MCGYFPKGKDITDIANKYIAKIAVTFNRLPRKSLGYKTPYEAFYGKLLHLA